MTSREFCYWLQGFFELSEASGPEREITPKQAELIQKHLKMVFIYEIDPSYPAEQQEALSETHAPSSAQPNNPVARC